LNNLTRNSIAILGIGVALVIGVIIFVFMQNNADHPSKNEEAMPHSPTRDYTKVYPLEDVEAGRESFQIYCASCHGMDAAGIEGLGVNLLTSSYSQHVNDETLLAFIIEGRPAWHPENKTGLTMPARAGFPRLTDAEIYQIIAYLRDIAP
jgi:mono/diheme cytochrome c family protein